MWLNLQPWLYKVTVKIPSESLLIYSYNKLYTFETKCSKGINPSVMKNLFSPNFAQDTSGSVFLIVTATELWCTVSHTKRWKNQGGKSLETNSSAAPTFDTTKGKISVYKSSVPAHIKRLIIQNLHISYQKFFFRNDKLSQATDEVLAKKIMEKLVWFWENK